MSQLLYCKKMVRNPMSTTTAIIEDSKWNGQNIKKVKHRYHPPLFQYHCTNTKSTLQKRLSHLMDNSASKKRVIRANNLWSTERDNEKSKHSRKHQRCMDHVTWNTSTEKRCIKGNWKWKQSTTKWAHQWICSYWRWECWTTSQYSSTRRKRYQSAKWHQWE